ncbi:hypothetical protein ACCO45_004920 [Purpureocillium lilacinum]|uniref:Uncharacterized protein n=1 Tax=Purpureocillium lilacinum TaxID=33203 RepID=A0ACC4DUM5_PURLI
MAADRAAVASGADLGDGLRKRPVAASQASLTPRVARPTIRRSSPKSFAETFDEWEPIFAPLIFTALAFFTRLWKIGLSDIVTWDEAQYGQPPAAPGGFC